MRTIFGAVSFGIPRLRCKGCNQSLNLNWGRLESLTQMAESNITPALRKVALLCGSSWPYRQGTMVLKELTGVSISHTHLRDLCADEAVHVKSVDNDAYQSAFNAALAETMETLVEYLADEPTPPTPESTSDVLDESWEPRRIYTGIDGTFINDLPAKRFFEAKAAIVFTDERVEVSKGRNLLLNKQYVASCQPVKEFGQQLFVCTTDMGVTDSTEHIILADGARWITTLARTQYPKAKLILDWWHLNKRVWETVDWLKQHGCSHKDARAWGRQIRDELWRGGTFAALHSCVRLGKQLGLAPSVDKSQTELGVTSLQSFYLFLRNNFNSIIDYHTYRKNGGFISSVFVEKTIDLLICRRLKLRGQNWSRGGADNVVAFREMILNGQWQNYWQQRQAA